jgi:hypothetical protein
MLRTIRMHLYCFFVISIIVLFTMVIVSCGQSTDSNTGKQSSDDTGYSGNNTSGAGDTGSNAGDTGAPGSSSGDTGNSGSNTGDTGGSGRWVPQVGNTWQWQLQGPVNTGYDVNAYDIDLFDSSAATIQGLHDAGRRVVCYFSAGSYEDWRPDAGDFTSADLGQSLDGWPGERWLDIRSTNVRNIMAARLDLAAQKGCDAVEPDNVDGYSNATGLPLTAADQLDYNRFLAQQAHQRNLAVALKNDVDQAAALVDDFDFTINEECHAYDECDALNVFIEAGKPVFNAEYDSQYVNNASARDSLCADALANGFSTLVLPLDLDDSFRYSCGAPGTDNPDTAGNTEGVLLGLFYGDENIAATSQKIQRTVPLHLTYYDFDDDWTGSITRNDIQAGRIPLVNWEIFSATLDDIIGGVYDSMLAQRATDAKALGAQIFVDFGAEMNGDWSPWGGAQNGNSADKYLAAYRHVHRALAEADNLIWLWCPNVTDEPRTAWNAAMNYYPGDDYVDWTGVDGYNWGNAGGAGWRSFEEIFADIYPQLAARNKPIMIGEMASAESGGNKAEFIKGIVPTLKSKFPRIKGLVWFDINKETDWRISSSPESEASFIEMAADPYFNPNQVDQVWKIKVGINTIHQLHHLGADIEAFAKSRTIVSPGII